MVYVVEDDSVDPWKRVLRWITSEEVAKANFGENWAAYVLVVAEDERFYTFGPPVARLEYTSAEMDLRSRVALNAGVTYELSIVLPDGTRRNGFGPYAHYQTLSDGVSSFSFEDREDMDFDDVVLQLDPTGCLTFEVSALPLDAAMHHEVWLTVYWDGIPQGDILVFEDSHDAVDHIATVVVDNTLRFGVVSLREGVMPRRGLFDNLADWIRALFK